MDSTINKKLEVGYFHSQRPEMLKYIPENAKRILDVGCSEGTFCNMISRPDRELWGVEI